FSSHWLRPLNSFPTRRSSDLSLAGSPRVVSTYRIKECKDGHGKVFGSLVDCFPGLSFRRWRRTSPFPNLPISSGRPIAVPWAIRSEEHTSELQSRENLVCRLL